MQGFGKGKWLQSLNTTAKCGTILLCHISQFRILHLPNPPPPYRPQNDPLVALMGLHTHIGGGGLKKKFYRLGGPVSAANLWGWGGGGCMGEVRGFSCLAYILGFLITS